MIKSRAHLILATSLFFVMPLLTTAFASSLEVNASGWSGLAQNAGMFGRVFLSPVSGMDGTSKTVHFNIDRDRNDPPGFAYHAQAVGSGSVNFGVFSGKISFVLQAMPESVTYLGNEVQNGGDAELVSHLILKFTDSGTVTSDSLPPGTPVTIKLKVITQTTGDLSEPTGIAPYNNPYPNGENAGLFSSGYVSLFDESTSNEINGAPYTENQTTVYTFNTAVGHRLDLTAQNVIDASGYAGAFQKADGSGGFYSQAEGSVDSATAVTFEAPAGVSFLADSGHNYLSAETTPSPSPTAHSVGNISTRGIVGTGDNVMIGGVIISGTAPKQVLFRALGPTLGQPPFNVPGVLADPLLELRASDGTLLVSNDNWTDAANASDITTTNLFPPNPAEAAILTSLAPGSYTAVVRGVGNSTGVAIIECYDIEGNSTSQLSNISTRGFVQTGDNVLIAGLVVKGPGSQTVVIRGLGPTLGQLGVPNPLADPLLDLRDANGNTLITNDNWKNPQQAEIQAANLNPPSDDEAAILTTLAPGNYTAILSGVNNTTGNALVEVYALD